MYDHAYINYLVHFHGDRDYFECHEVLEEHWKEAPPSERKDYWVGLIQIAVGLYHQRRGNFKGALKMINSSINLLTVNTAAITQLGLQANELLVQLQRVKADIIEYKPYKSFPMPIADQALKAKCIEECKKRGLIWDQESDLKNEFILHKHSKRDRTDVIKERELNLLKRQKDRGCN
ncbi:DUF309 domain-containing protein [Metabacillus fastidiosus]|uniref:DUF309 domain-containing protein n=1 Tax=Metabacillus fastidiosus TaxID=1458 RepID=UPI003D28F7DC